MPIVQVKLCASLSVGERDLGLGLGLYSVVQSPPFDSIEMLPFADANSLSHCDFP